MADAAEKSLEKLKKKLDRDNESLEDIIQKREELEEKAKKFEEKGKLSDSISGMLGAVGLSSLSPSLTLASGGLYTGASKTKEAFQSRRMKKIEALREIETERTRIPEDAANDDMEESRDKEQSQQQEEHRENLLQKVSSPVDLSEESEQILNRIDENTLSSEMRLENIEGSLSRIEETEQNALTLQQREADKSIEEKRESALRPVSASGDGAINDEDFDDLGKTFQEGLMQQNAMNAVQRAAQTAATVVSGGVTSILSGAAAGLGATKLGGLFKKGKSAVTGKVGSAAKSAKSAGTGLLSKTKNVGKFLGKGAKAAGRILNPVGKVAAAGTAGYAAGSFLNKKFIEGTAVSDTIGSGIANTMAFFGNDEAQAAKERMRKATNQDPEKARDVSETNQATRVRAGEEGQLSRADKASESDSRKSARSLDKAAEILQKNDVQFDRDFKQARVDKQSAGKFVDKYFQNSLNKEEAFARKSGENPEAARESLKKEYVQMIMSDDTADLMKETKTLSRISKFFDSAMFDAAIRQNLNNKHEMMATEAATPAGSSMADQKMTEAGSRDSMQNENRRRAIESGKTMADQAEKKEQAGMIVDSSRTDNSRVDQSQTTIVNNEHDTDLSIRKMSERNQYPALVR